MIRSLIPHVVLLSVAALHVACDQPNPTTPIHLQSECAECLEAQEPQCWDEIDNDEDGLLDCDDPDCAFSATCPWKGDENTDTKCADGLDNDANGFTDCQDFECHPTTACDGAEDTAEACSNGTDDDFDSYVDCDDWDCDAFCITEP